MEEKGRKMEKLRAEGLHHVRLSESMFLDQVQEATALLLAVSNDDLLWGFRNRAGITPNPGKMLDGWYGNGVFHVFGQLLGGTVRQFVLTGDKRLERKANEMLAGWYECIRDDGYAFQNAEGCNDPYYEYEKLCGGLCDCIEFLHCELALAGLSRMTDWAIKNLDISCTQVNEDHAPYYEWFTLPENIYRAYLLTGDEKYRFFAERWEYPLYWDRFLTPVEHLDIVPRHAYSHINTLSSAAMAYRVTKDKKYLDIIKNAYDYITSTQIYVTGGYGPQEKLFREKGYLGETLLSPLDICFGHVEVSCCSWAVFKLCKYLLEFTGDTKYADWAEKMLYNVLLPELPPLADGKVMYYAYYYLNGAVKNRHDGRFVNDNGTTFEWVCCSGSYHEAVAEYGGMIYFDDGESLYISQYIPSTYHGELKQGNIEAEISTDYPREETIRLRLTASAKVSVKLRKPLWAKHISINGANKDTDEMGWVTVTLDAGTSELLIKIECSLYFVPIDSQHQDIAALCYGPVVLTSNFSGIYIGDPEKPSEWIKSDGKLRFETIPGTSCAYPYRIHTFKPFFEVPENEVYYMYHKFKQP